MDQSPEILLQAIYLLGLLLLVLGLVKLLIYLIGELKPSLWSFIKSDWLKKCLSGFANRLIFGLGGFLTALLGGGCMWAAKLLERYLPY